MSQPGEHDPLLAAQSQLTAALHELAPFAQATSHQRTVVDITHPATNEGLVVCAQLFDDDDPRHASGLEFYARSAPGQYEAPFARSDWLNPASDSQTRRVVNSLIQDIPEPHKSWLVFSKQAAVLRHDLSAQYTAAMMGHARNPNRAAFETVEAQYKEGLRASAFIIRQLIFAESSAPIETGHRFTIEDTVLTNGDTLRARWSSLAHPLGSIGMQDVHISYTTADGTRHSYGPDATENCMVYQAAPRSLTAVDFSEMPNPLGLPATPANVLHMADLVRIAAAQLASQDR